MALVSQKSLLLSNSYSLIFYRIRIFEMSSCLVPEKAIIRLIGLKPFPQCFLPSSCKHTKPPPFTSDRVLIIGNVLSIFSV